MAALLNALLALPALLTGSLGRPGTDARESITFILGSDEDASQPMFRLAEDHFRQDPRERTDQVVLGLRSLEEVRGHLSAAHRAGGRPWGVINLVVHGTPAGLIDLALRPGGPRLGERALRADAASPNHAPVPDALLDGASEVRVHGCSAGRNPDLLSRLSRWLGGTDAQRPCVRATPWFTSFQATSAPGGAPSRSLCQSWDIHYRPGKRPSREELATRRLARAAPAGLPVEEALANRGLRTAGGAYSYEAPVRFTWTVVYPGASGAPSLPGGLMATPWLAAQPAFLERLRSNGLALHHLHWKVAAATQDMDGVPCPALRVEGEGRVLHVLRQLVRPSGETGPEPHEAWDDPRYYTTAR